MYRSAILFFCLFGAISSVVPANADTAAEARKAIDAIYKQRHAAIEHKNVDAYMASFTSDFVTTNRSGRVYSLSQVRDLVQRSMTAKASGKTTLAIQQCTAQGSIAQAVIVEHYTATGFLPQSKEAPNKVAYTLANDSTMETVWVKTANGWQEKSARMLHYKSTREE